MSLTNEHRGRPLGAAYHDPQVAAPEKPRHRAATRWWLPSWVTGLFANLRDWIAHEWKLTAIYLVGGVLVFVGILASQHYWPNETMAVWGTMWRIGLICAGANLFVLLLLEWSLRPFEHPDADDEQLLASIDRLEVVRVEPREVITSEAYVPLIGRVR